jgi:hypothetical protein
MFNQDREFNGYTATKAFTKPLTIFSKRITFVEAIESRGQHFHRTTFWWRFSQWDKNTTKHQTQQV